MKHVSLLVPELEPQLISIVGSFKAFNRVNNYLISQSKQAAFTIQLVSAAGRVEVDDGLFTIHPHAHITEVEETDLIVIPAISWDFEQSLPANQSLIPWIRNHYRKGAEVASVCTGGFLLAATGLLDGKDCSTHWMGASLFRSMYPKVNLTIEKIITDESGLYTSGGALSYINLILYLIEKYVGREVAVYCSKFLEVDIDRTSQSPFMIFTGLKNHQDEAIKKAQVYIENHVNKKISIEELSSSLAIGRRNFDRRFIKATSNTLVEYLQRVKIEAAKKALETTKSTVNEVMYSCGYSDLKAFREVFKKITGLSPLDYRHRYNKELF